MNEQETLKVLAVLEVAYPAFYSKQEASKKELTLKLWAYQFDSIPHKVVNAGLMSLISTRTDSFPPTIGELKAEIARICDPEKLTPMEAWDLVKKAMRGCGYGNTKQAWSKLPKSVQDVVSPQELEAMAFDERFNNGVEFSNFQKSYLAKKKERNDFNLLPCRVQELLKSNIESLSLSSDSKDISKLQESYNKAIGAKSKIANEKKGQ